MELTKLNDFWKERDEGQKEYEFPLLACVQDLKTGQVRCFPTPRIGNKEVHKALSSILKKIMDRYSKEDTLEERIAEFEELCKSVQDQTIMSTFETKEEMDVKLEIAKKYKKGFSAIPIGEEMQEYAKKQYEMRAVQN